MTPLCDAEIMAIVTIGALLMYPALIGYSELVIFIEKMIDKIAKKGYRHEQNKKA
jgi:hypothetical protein